jgi:chaperonin cofactor prefoldin
MVGPEDMSTPVTRGELRDEIDRLEQKFESRLAQMATKADLAEMATKADLAEMATKADLAQMATKADLAQMATKADLAQMATKADLNTWGRALVEHLMTELARHTKASQEALSMQISTIDDKYKDLPARVSHLEAAVFAPKKR